MRLHVRRPLSQQHIRGLTRGAAHDQGDQHRRLLRHTLREDGFTQHLGCPEGRLIKPCLQSLRRHLMDADGWQVVIHPHNGHLAGIKCRQFGQRDVRHGTNDSRAQAAQWVTGVTLGSGLLRLRALNLDALVRATPLCQTQRRQAAAPHTAGVQPNHI